ncbi:MAG: alpha/beta hydrolase [Rhodothermales bacterium]
MPLWPNGPAEENGLTGAEEMGGCIRNISEPALAIYLPEEATGKAVVVMPGGGYGGVCIDSEGKQIADILTAQGIAAIVLKYRLPNQHHNIPADDARRAIRTARHHAAAWHINPDKIGVWGFSAGGHLASTVSTVFDAGDDQATDPIEQQSSRPDFAILFYPVITMDESVTHVGSRRNLIGPDAEYEMVQRYSSELQITENTPPTFILHAGDDKVVPEENSLRYYRQLVANDVAARLLIFETGGHGPNVFKGNPSWSPVFNAWLSER